MHNSQSIRVFASIQQEEHLGVALLLLLHCAQLLFVSAIKGLAQRLILGIIVTCKLQTVCLSEEDGRASKKTCHLGSLCFEL